MLCDDKDGFIKFDRAALDEIIEKADAVERYMRLKRRSHLFARVGVKPRRNIHGELKRVLLRVQPVDKRRDIARHGTVESYSENSVYGAGGNGCDGILAAARLKRLGKEVAVYAVGKCAEANAAALNRKRSRPRRRRLSFVRLRVFAPPSARTALCTTST